MAVPVSQRQFKEVERLVAAGTPRDEAIAQVMNPVGSAPTGYREKHATAVLGEDGHPSPLLLDRLDALDAERQDTDWFQATKDLDLHGLRNPDTGTGMIERTDGAPYKGSTSGLHADKYLANFEDRWGVPVKELTDAVGWSPIQKALSEGKSFRAATPEWGDTPWDNYHEAVSDGLRERVPGLFFPENQEKIWEDLLFIKQKSDEAMAADPDWPRRYDELQ